MSNNISNNITFNNPYGDLSINGPLTCDTITTDTLNNNITLDKDTIITCGDITIRVGDLFRKLKILDIIIKEQYPEELLK